MAQLPALHKACLDGSLEGVRAALAKPDAPQVLQTPDADGRTPLHWAASSDAKHALIAALHAAGPLEVYARDARLWAPRWWPRSPFRLPQPRLALPPVVARRGTRSPR